MVIKHDWTTVAFRLSRPTCTGQCDPSLWLWCIRCCCCCASASSASFSGHLPWSLEIHFANFELHWSNRKLIKPLVTHMRSNSILWVSLEPDGAWLMQRSGHCSSLWRLVERGNTFYMANITWGGSGLAFSPAPAAPELTLCVANCSFCCCSSKSSQLWEHPAAFIKYLFLVISEDTGMKLSILGFIFGSVDLKSQSQSPGAWQMVAGVDVSCNSTENRCVQGNCRGVVARKSRNGTLRPYAGVFIVKSASCFRHHYMGHWPWPVAARCALRADGAGRAGLCPDPEQGRRRRCWSRVTRELRHRSPGTAWGWEGPVPPCCDCLWLILRLERELAVKGCVPFAARLNSSAEPRWRRASATRGAPEREPRPGQAGLLRHGRCWQLPVGCSPTSLEGIPACSLLPRHPWAGQRLDAFAARPRRWGRPWWDPWGGTGSTKAGPSSAASSAADHWRCQLCWLFISLYISLSPLAFPPVPLSCRMVSVLLGGVAAAPQPPQQSSPLSQTQLCRQEPGAGHGAGKK